MATKLMLSAERQSNPTLPSQPSENSLIGVEKKNEQQQERYHAIDGRTAIVWLRRFKFPVGRVGRAKHVLRKRLGGTLTAEPV